MYYVYLIQHSETKENYIGYSSNVINRLSEHNSGKNKSTKRKSGTWVLVYYEAFLSEKDALIRERRLKSHGKGKQELLKRLKHSTI